MNPKLLVLLCIASASCVELENVCSSGHFRYNGVMVNAFHRSRLNVTFPGLSHYLINSSVTCSPSEFADKDNYWKTLKVKNDFNRKFTEFYTNDLNNITAKELEEKSNRMVFDCLVPLTDIVKLEPTSTCVKTFGRAVLLGYKVQDCFERFVKFNAYPIESRAGYRPSNSEAIRMLEELFEKLNTGASGQTFALKKTASDVYLEMKGFVQMDEFKFLTDGSVRPDTEAMVIYEQYLPFNNACHTDSGCVSVEKLPLFYKNKGSK